MGTPTKLLLGGLIIITGVTSSLSAAVCLALLSVMVYKAQISMEKLRGEHRKSEGHMHTKIKRLTSRVDRTTK